AVAAVGRGTAFEVSIRFACASVGSRLGSSPEKLDAVAGSFLASPFSANSTQDGTLKRFLTDSSKSQASVKLRAGTVTGPFSDFTVLVTNPRYCWRVNVAYGITNAIFPSLRRYSSMHRTKKYAERS